MNIATEGKPQRALLDTNVIVSALVFGGKPGHILALSLEKRFHVITSPILLAEIEDVINKKFPLSGEDLRLFRKQTQKTFGIVNPKKTISLLKDDADNRVLEAAVEGRGQYIITGDKELLSLGKFKGIRIIRVAEFLDIFYKKAE